MVSNLLTFFSPDTSAAQVSGEYSSILIFVSNQGFGLGV